MSDEVKGLTVVLDKDYGEEATKVIVDAIQMIKGVQSVTSHKVSGSDYIDRRRIKFELRSKMHEIIDEALK